MSSSSRLGELCRVRRLSYRVRPHGVRWLAIAVDLDALTAVRATGRTRDTAADACARLVRVAWPRRQGAPAGNRNADRAHRALVALRLGGELRAARGAR